MTFKPVPSAPAIPEPSLEHAGVFLSSAEALVNWSRRNSLWPFPFGTACCGIEFMGVVSSMYDISRFGAELVRFSPRQADVIIIAGTVTYKQAPVLRRIYDQMCDPKWVIAAGACATSGGFYDCYCTMPGIDEVIPVDIYIAGCPPRPEAFLEGIIQLQKKIDGEKFRDSRAMGAERRATTTVAA